MVITARVSLGVIRLLVSLTYICASFVPLMRSSNAKRIKSNSELYDFSLDEDDMTRLDALDKGTKGSIGWNPIFVD